MRLVTNGRQYAIFSDACCCYHRRRFR